MDTPASATPAPPAKKSRGMIPLKLSPKVQQAIRLVAGGMDRRQAADQMGIKYVYLTRVLSAPIGRDELNRILGTLERVAIDKMTTPAGSGSGAVMRTPITEASDEIEAAILETIRRLRNIVKTSKSDAAVVKAAQEILGLANASKRIAASQTPQDEGIPLTGEDAGLLTSVLADLRAMNATPPADAGSASLNPPTAAPTDGDPLPPSSDEQAPGAGSPDAPAAWTSEIVDHIVTNTDPADETPAP